MLKRCILLIWDKHSKTKTLAKDIYIEGLMVLVQLYPRVFAILYIQLSYFFEFQAKILQRQIIYTARAP